MKKFLVHGIAVVALSATAFAQSGQTPAQPRTPTTPQTPATTPQTSTPKPQTSANSRSTNPDAAFVMEAARGGMSEVALGELARQKASSDEVKQFGQRMVTDHGKANDELKALAGEKSITLPTEVSAQQKALHDRLEKLSGAEFDRAYMKEMVSDHQKDVAAFRKESQSGKDPEIKAWAGKTLPTLEAHLKEAQSANKAVGTSGKSSGAKPTGTSGTDTKSPSSSSPPSSSPSTPTQPDVR